MSPGGLSGLNPAYRFPLVADIITTGSGCFMKVAEDTIGRIVITIPARLFMCLARCMSSQFIIRTEAITTGVVIIAIMIGTATIAMGMGGGTIGVIAIERSALVKSPA